MKYEGFVTREVSNRNSCCIGNQSNNLAISDFTKGATVIALSSRRDCWTPKASHFGSFNVVNFVPVSLKMCALIYSCCTFYLKYFKKLTEP